MTNRAAPLSGAIGALALGVAAVALATDGDWFRAALLGIAAYLVFNVLLWLAGQVWPTPSPNPPPRVSNPTDEPADPLGDEPALPPTPDRPPTAAEGS